MTIDLSAVPTLTDTLGLYDIPLQRDTFPYAQLQAQGRYPDRSTPNTLPEFLATLNASDGNFIPDMLSTDGKRNLNVNIAAGGGGGGGAVIITPGSYYNSDAITDLDFGGNVGSNPQFFEIDLSPLSAITHIWFAIQTKVASLTTSMASFRLDFRANAGPTFYWPVALLFPTYPPVANGFAMGQVVIPFVPPVDVQAVTNGSPDVFARVWGGGVSTTAEILVVGLAA